MNELKNKSLKQNKKKSLRFSKKQTIGVLAACSLVLGGGILASTNPAHQMYASIVASQTVKADQTSGNSTVLNLAKCGGEANNPNFDNGPIISKMIAQLPKDGGEIKIPAGDWYIKTPVNINKSFVTIKGVNDGWRSGVDPANSNGAANGGSHLVLANSGDAIDVKSADSHRLSGDEFQDFSITGNNSTGTGINVQSDNDHITIEGMSMKNLDNPIVDKGADCISITNNQIAENKNGIALTGASQQAKISSNQLGAQPGGIAVALENPASYNINDNLVYPDGSSNICLYNPVHGTVDGNTLSSYTNGIINILPNSKGQMGNANVISGNQLSVNSWKTGYGINVEGQQLVNDTKWGVIHVAGFRNLISDNNLEMNMPANSTGILIMAGDSNRISDDIIDGGHSSNNSRVVVNGKATNTIVSGTLQSNNSFQNGNNSSNVNHTL